MWGIKGKICGAKLHIPKMYHCALGTEYHINCYTTVPVLKFDWPSGIPRMVIHSITALRCFTVCITQFICVQGVPGRERCWVADKPGLKMTKTSQFLPKMLDTFYQWLVYITCTRARSHSQLCLISDVIICGKSCSPADIHYHHTPARDFAHINLQF